MHTISNGFRALALLSIVSFAPACKDEPPTVESATQARTKFCKDGGAEFSAETNECVCPYAAHWNGARCEGAGESQAKSEPAPAAAQPALPEALAPVEPPEAEEPKADQRPQAVSESATAAGVDEALQRVCRKAKAHWVEEGGYCLCPKNQILVGKTCRDVQGRITDDACLRAVHKGKWRKGECSCPSELVFVPARGGCVARLAATDTPNVTLYRRICESSLNRGKWDAVGVRCQCPAGKIWHDELCQVQQNLTSRTVCESAYNQGTWNKAAKTCTCKPGYNWINQACLSAKTISEKAACEAEASKATWNAAAGRCICPGLTKWDSQALRCTK